MNPNTYEWSQCDEEPWQSAFSPEEQEMVDSEPETMTVVVMYRNNWFGGDGWTYYAKTVTISAFCPTCGEHRGTPTWHQQCEDGEWFSLNIWENPCGHKDTYHDVLIEAGVTV